MIQPISFSEEHIRELQKTSKRDPVLLERAVYAFWTAGGSGPRGNALYFQGRYLPDAPDEPSAPVVH